MTVESEALADILADADLAADATYQRGLDSAAISAVSHDEERMGFNDSGLSIRAFVRFWQLPLAELPFGLPVRGDRITQGDNTYEVLPFDGEPEWHYLGSGRTAVEILTKQIPGS